MKGCAAEGLIHEERMKSQLAKKSHVAAYGLELGQVKEVKVSSTNGSASLNQQWFNTLS
jgi:hypothetical protein